MKYLYLTFFITYSSIAVCQTTSNGNNSRGIDIAAAHTGFITELKTVQKKSVGSAYLYDDYKQGTIVFLNGDSVQLPVNLNIADSQVEMLHDGMVKVANGRVVKDIYILDNIPRTKYSYDYVELPDDNYFGITSDFYSGQNFDVSLIFEFETKEGYYVKALDVGDKKITYSINRIFVYQSNNGETKILDRGSKKRFAKNFSQTDSIYQFIKKNKLDIKNENDLKIVLEFIDSNL